MVFIGLNENCNYLYGLQICNLIVPTIPPLTSYLIVASGVHGADTVMTLVGEEGLEGKVPRYANIGKLSHTAPGVVRVEIFG